MNSTSYGSNKNIQPDAYEQHHEQTIWTRYAVIFMGAWLLACLPTFGIPCLQMAWSDGISGLLLIAFGYLSLSVKRIWAPWMICLIGIWLQLAPLIYWSPTAFGYLNDTITGMIVIGLSILIPGTPGLIEDPGPDTPSGWSYNPSSWIQRLPIILLTCICWFTSRYMAAFQLGYIDHMWDPVFGSGTLNVITSSISKDFPVSDAGLGAAVYTIEALMGAKGGVRRWRSMPWIVALFGILVVPAGLVSIVLIMLQPLLIGSWCFWCLLTAACMLLMIALTVDEVVAVVQYVKSACREGHSFQQIFWKGGPPLAHSSFDTDAPSLAKPSTRFFSASYKGVDIPWNLLLSLALGIWLLFHMGPYPMANNVGHIFGALTITFSIIAMAEVTRAVRFINILLGTALIFIPFFTNASTMITFRAILVGILLILLAIPLGKIKEKYGDWQSNIR